jgi:hypothetical protein
LATPAQINANRANAQKSTGPRSVEGKSVSRFNALKHGIDAASIVIPGEDPAEYEALAAHYLDEYRPKSASEHFHVDTMLRAGEQINADVFNPCSSASIRGSAFFSQTARTRASPSACQAKPPWHD